MKGEVMELVVTACEKHSTNNEVSYRLHLVLNAMYHYVTLHVLLLTPSQLYTRIQIAQCRWIITTLLHVQDKLVRLCSTEGKMMCEYLIKIWEEVVRACIKVSVLLRHLLGGTENTTKNLNRDSQPRGFRFELSTTAVIFCVSSLVGFFKKFHR